MLFGNMFRRTKPRGLTWTPRYFDPDDDKALEQERQKSRVQFERYRTRASTRRSSGPSMFMLVVFVLMVGAVIWVAQRTDFSGRAPETQLTPMDAAPHRPATLTVEKEIGTISPADRAADTSQSTVSDTAVIPEPVE